MRRWLLLGASATVAALLGASATVAALLAWPAHVGSWTRVGCVVWFCVMLDGAYWLGRRDALRRGEAQARERGWQWDRALEHAHFRRGWQEAHAFYAARLGAERPDRSR